MLTRKMLLCSVGQSHSRVRLSPKTQTTSLRISTCISSSRREICRAPTRV
jgi:hypothetical protein